MSSSNVETTPLILESGNRSQADHTCPLPKLQIVPLLLAYFADTVVATFTYPFLAQLIGDLDVVQGNPDRVGYYMGTLDSIGYLTAAIAVLQWGYYSDYAGRKKVLLANLFGLAVAIICFGLSKTFLCLVLSKFLEGVFKGSKPTVRTAAAESSAGDESRMAFFFSLVPIAYAAGSAIGPFIGGALAKPSERFPRLFGAQLWLDHPYLLPCLVAALCCIVPFVSGLIFLEETLPSLRGFQNPDSKSYNAVNGTSLPASTPSRCPAPSHGTPDGNPQPDAHSSTPHGIDTKTRRLLLVFLNYGVFCLLAISFNAVFALFLASPISSGGLSFPPHTIGLILSLGSILHGVFQAIFFTRMHRQWGLRNVYIVAMAAFVLLYAAMPIMAAIVRRAGRVNALVWVLLGLEEMLCIFIPAAFSCIYIFITKASPHPSALGRMHAAAQTIFSLMGAIGPASATALVAASIQYNLLGGALAHVVLVVLGVVGVGLASLLSDDERRRND